MVYYRRRYGGWRVVKRVTFVREVATAAHGNAELMELLKKAFVVVAAALFALLLAACVEVLKTEPHGDPAEASTPAPQPTACVPGDDPIAVPATIGANGFVRHRQRAHEGTYEQPFTLPAADVLRAQVWIQRPGETHPGSRRSISGGTMHGTTYTLEVIPVTGKVRLHLVAHGYGHEGPPPPPVVVERIERLANMHPGAAVLDYAVAALAGVKVYVRVCPRA